MLRRLSAHGEVGFTELAEEFGVSEMTIRRDLETLEADGLARRVRGGAISVVSRSYEPPLAVRATTASAAKTAIGAAAAGLVNDGDTVIIDVGTTTLELAQVAGLRPPGWRARPTGIQGPGTRGGWPDPGRARSRCLQAGLNTQRGRHHL